MISIRRSFSGKGASRHLVVAALVAACSGALACAGTTRTAAATPAAAPPRSLSGRVVAVELSKESIMYTRAQIAFHNPGPEPCRVVRYEVSWPGSVKQVAVGAGSLGGSSRGDATIPAGATVTRWLVIHPGDGDLGALDVASSRVDVQAECGPRVAANAQVCRAWDADRLVGKTVEEAKALIGEPVSVAADGSSAEWYRSSPKHVNPYLRATLTDGRITSSSCGLR
jgi:hypothetical protein